MSDLLPLVFVGLATGSVFAIAALGLVLTFKTSGVFNFAHGAQAAAAAYLMYTLRQEQGWPWPLAALVAVVIVGVGGGLLLERMSQALTGASTTERVVAAIGLLIGLQGLLVMIYGHAAIPMAPFLPERLVELPGVNVRLAQLIEMALALLAAGALYVLFRRSRLGLTMQAVVDEPDLLALQGVSPARVRRQAWILGSIFASVSGILVAPTVGLDVNVLTLLVVAAFGAAAVGGFDNLLLTYVGALGIGLAVAVLPGYVGPLAPLTGQAVFPFLVLFVALVLGPARLVQRGGPLVRRTKAPRPLPAITRGSGLAAGVAVLLLLPVFVGSGIGVYTRALTFVILFASLDLLVRASGQVSLSHMVFAAVGAVVYARAVSAGIPWPLALLAGGVATVPLGMIVAVPAMLLPGIYLAIATFGFGILVERIAFHSSWMFGHGGNLPVAVTPSLPLPLGREVSYYYLVLGITLACLGLVLLVRRARLGRLLRGLAESPVALSAHGINVNVTRLLVFCLSAFLAGIAGALMGPITGVVSSASYDFFTSLVLVAVLAISGRRPLLSPFVAAFAFAVLPWLIDDPVVLDLLPIGFGLAAVIAALSYSRSTGASVVEVKRTRSRGRSRSPMASRPLVESGVKV
jgi:branched-subunit amino acid ABC-type transport system permease component